MENNTVFARSSATNSGIYQTAFWIRHGNAEEAQSAEATASIVT